MVRVSGGLAVLLAERQLVDDDSNNPELRSADDF